jgi:glycosyltransferase involved in cell wall biosynthesis
MKFSSSSSKIILLDACNFTNSPLGGQLTGARMLMSALGSRLSLAGWTDDPSAPIGRWHTRKIDGIEYDFFATAYIPESLSEKPLIPARATNWLRFKWFGKDILSCGIYNILTQEPTVIMALPFTKRHNVCFWFPGIEPALSVSRYRWAKYFMSGFDKVFIHQLSRCSKKILAAADNEAIAGLLDRTKGKLEGKGISFFPTRVDTALFNPGDSSAAREEIGLPREPAIIVTSGRLHRAKGWPLLLEASVIFIKKQPDTLFIFIGDGSDRQAIEQDIAKKKLTNKVIFAGLQPPRKLSLYLQAADLFVMGSEKEGWSTSLIEALSTGLPIVTTRFSSADSIVKNGVNGFVVGRNPKVFAQAMSDALMLSGVKEYSLEEVKKYALSNLAADLEKVWPLSQV